MQLHSQLLFYPFSMKSMAIFLFLAFFCLGQADPSPTEGGNYRKELRELYTWTKNEIKPYALDWLNLTQQVGHNTIEHPQLYEGQDPATIQPFVDKQKQYLSNFDEAMKHVESEDFMEKTMHAYRIASHFKWKEGLTESTVKHLESIQEEAIQQSFKEIDAVSQKPTKEFYDKFLARLDETIDKLTPSEREAHAGLIRWRVTRESGENFWYFHQTWIFLFWAYNELNTMEPSKIE